MKIQPINNNVLVKIEKENDKTESGIYLPETRDKERPGEGVVEAVDEGVKEVQAGDRVIFVRHGHHNLKDQDKIIISLEDILAKIL